MRTFRLSLLFAVLLLLGAAGPTTARAQATGADTPTVSPDWFETLEYRFIGPYRGGRVTAVAGIPEQPHTFFMGSTGGGVWKTDDAGRTWGSLSDGHFGAGSIGAIAVAPSDPEVLYVGTGSAAPRGNVSAGVGMYRSLDGGATWSHAGLRDAGQIARIQVHPDDPDWAYVAVLGNIFGPSSTRGVYRTTDGGGSWERVLFVSDSTGAIDLAMDPSNPRILYAAMWRAERKPWTLIDGGTEGGVFKSIDGGTTWVKLGGGLPTGRLGKIGVAVSPANPDRVWALVQEEDNDAGGLYRSDDAGQSFERVTRDRSLRQRGWYYSYVIADPQDEHTVYVLNVGLHRSVDGGQTFERIPVPHGDNHGLWINPNDPKIMINSNDGGANVTLNGAKTWSSQTNQPTAEFYRLTVDDQFPYRVYGAQQDNSTLSLPSKMAGDVSPKQHWYSVGGGESGHIAVDPRDPDVIYAGNYIGQITRFDRSQWHQRDVVAYPQMHDGVAPRDIRYRFQWNAPIRLSPHDPDVLYHTSQYVHRSTDGGQSWSVISPDLTTNNDAYHDIPGGPIQHDHTGVELYTTIFAFEESPHEAGVLWAGSDDGLVHLSRDNGATWADVTPQGMPTEGTVNMIEISPHDPAAAYIAVYKYRENDFRPYVFKTEDYGASWRLLTDGTNGIEAPHFVRVVRADPDRAGLLYAGTEFGMYVSFDDGATWQPFQQNLPATPITDLAVHEQDLVVSTQGRGFWVMDNVTPLHQLSGDFEDGVHLLDPRPAHRTQLRPPGGPASPEAYARGAELYLYVEGAMPMDTVTVVVVDAEGRVAHRFSTHADADARGVEKISLQEGLNRLTWPMRYEPPNVIESARFSLANLSGPHATPGTYTLRLAIGGAEHTTTLGVRKDPRWSVTDDDLSAQFALTLQVRSLLNQAHDAVRTIRAVRDQTQALAAHAKSAGYGTSVRVAADSVDAALRPIEEALIQTKSESRQDPINFPPMLDDQIAYLYSIVNGQDARPTAGAYERFGDLQAELATQLAALDTALATELEQFYAVLEAEGVERVVLPEPTERD